MFEMHVNVCIHIISYLLSFQRDYVWKCVMDFNVDARNGYEDPSNFFLEKTVKRKTNRRAAFNTVAVRQFENCTYTASLE
jgi:hypothetical protein